MSENRVREFINIVTEPLPQFNSTIQCIYYEFQGSDISVATISRLLEQMEGGAHGGGGYGHYHYHYHLNT